MSQIPPVDEPLEPPRQDFLRTWVWRILATLILAVVLFVTYRLSAAFLPRWWAQFIGGLVNGSFTAGMAWGVFFGFVFTFVPLTVALSIRYRVFNPKAKIAILVIAFVLATPNWLTLFVTFSDRPSAVAGWQTFNVTAPTFMWSTAIGAIVGAALSMWIFTIRIVAKRRGRKLAEYKNQAQNPPDVSGAE